MSAIGLITSISTTAAAGIPGFLGVAVAVMGVILAAKALKSAIEPPPSDQITKNVYHGDAITRHSDVENDVIILRVHLDDLQLKVTQYRKDKLKPGTHSISDIINDDNTEVTPIFEFNLTGPQKICVHRLIELPNLVPTGVEGTDLNEVNGMSDITTISGSIVQYYSSKFEKAKIYEGLDCFGTGDSLPTVQFAYSSSTLTHIMQGTNADIGNGNIIIPLPNKEWSVLPLKHMEVKSAGEEVLFDSHLTPEVAIESNPNCWAYTAIMAQKGDPGPTNVTGYCILLIPTDQQ